MFGIGLCCGLANTKGYNRKIIAAKTAWETGTTWALAEDNPWKYDGRPFGYWQWWQPSALGAGTIWYNPCDLTSVSLVGSNITQINDKIGTNHLTQSTGAYQPVLASNIINRQHVIDCNGTGWLKMATQIDGYEKDFFVICYSRANDSRIVMGGFNRNNQLRATSSYNSATPAYAPDTFAEDKPNDAGQVDTCCWRMGTTALTIYRNAAQGATSNTYTSGTNGTLIGQVGGRQGNVDIYTGRLMDIVIAPTLSADNFAKVFGWSAWKSGTQEKLPALHAYKAEAPRL
jgi:hypothetical protein